MHYVQTCLYKAVPEYICNHLNRGIHNKCTRTYTSDDTHTQGLRNVQCQNAKHTGVNDFNK